MQETVRVRVLGPLEVDGVPREAFGSRKARTLLKVLALSAGKPVPVDALVEACWGEEAPARPADQLAVLVSRVRRVLGRDRIVHGDGGYTLVSDWTDVGELEALAVEAERRMTAGNLAGARAAAAAGLSLVRGPVFADEHDAPWALVERAAVERTVARLRYVGAEAALTAGDFAGAATLAGAALDHDPYDETALRAVMTAHAGAGRPASALAAYAAVRARLADDLGVDPAPETEALHTAILRNEPLPGGEPVRPAPPGPSLPGRDAELATLAEALAGVRPGAVRVVGVEGEAGIGKTALLDAFAARAAASGAVVLRARCDELERALPLQAVLDAIAGRLSELGPDEAALARGDDAVLAPFLDAGAGPVARSGAERLGRSVTGPTLFYLALADLVDRLAGAATAVLLFDDAHLAGRATADWLELARRRPRHAGWLVVEARRPGSGPVRQEDATVDLGPVDLAAAEVIVGPEAAAAFYERSGGNPLFLVELAAAEGDEVPDSIRAAVAARCAEAGEAADTLAAASLLGDEIDVDLLAAVTNLSPLALLDHLEEGVRRRILAPEGATFVFRHELVRVAMAAGVAAGRAALVHRQAARTLAARARPDPLAVALHARLGGDTELAAGALLDGAMLAAERFDYAASDEMLGRSVALADRHESRLLRARIRVLRGAYREAMDDARVAIDAGAGPPGLEVAAWAAYYARDFGAARDAAADGARLAVDPATGARCLTVAGRTCHATGDLRAAEDFLTRAVGLAEGPDLAVTSTYLGVLRAHQSRPGEALDLMRAATRFGGSPVEVGAFFHAMFFTGHAHAMSGRPGAALDVFGRLAAEAERRQVDRYLDGRPQNFTGWVLRALGAFAAADDQTAQALEAATSTGNRETRTAAVIDLAEAALLRGDLDAATARLDEVDVGGLGSLVFGWRHGLKVAHHRARIALEGGDADQAETVAAALVDEAERLAIRRYAVPARLLVARARRRRGDPVEPAALEADLARLEEIAALEAWSITAELAHELGVPAWWARAEEQVERLARQAGEHAAGFLAWARRRVDALRP